MISLGLTHSLAQLSAANRLQTTALLSDVEIDRAPGHRGTHLRAGTTGDRPPRYRWTNWRWWLGLNPSFPTTTAPRTVAVIIPAHNEEACIAETIKSVLAQTAAIEQVIVVDDASTDRTGEIASQFPEVELVRPTVNQGSKPRAQNYALKFVRADLFVTIDADTLLAPDAIEQLLPYFSDPKTGAVCGFVIPQRVNTLFERGRFIEYLFGCTLSKGAQNQVGAVVVASGCFAAYPTELVLGQGGFPPGTMAEDMDLTWRLAKKGYEVYFHDTAYCYPIDPPNLKIFVAQVDRWYRGVLQNLSTHSFRGRLRLGLFVYWYMFDALLTPLSLFFAVYAYTGDVALPLAVMLLHDLAIVAPPAFFKAASIGRFWQAVVSFPAFLVLRPINKFILWRAMWREWIKRDKLKHWVKGH